MNIYWNSIPIPVIINHFLSKIVHLSRIWNFRPVHNWIRWQNWIFCTIHFLLKNWKEKGDWHIVLLFLSGQCDDFSVMFVRFFCSIPSWAEEVMKPGSDFEYLAFVYFTIFTHSTEMKKLRSGYLLKEILDHSTNKSMSTLSPDRSLWMYFAHDNTIADMLNSLGLFEVS